MSAGLYNFTIEQGVTFNETFTWTGGDGNAIDLTGYTARMQIRDNKGVMLLDLSSDLAIDGPNGKVTLTIPFATTALCTWKLGHYDLKLTGSGIADRLIQGEVSVSPQTTV